MIHRRRRVWPREISAHLVDFVEVAFVKASIQKCQLGQNYCQLKKPMLLFMNLIKKWVKQKCAKEVTKNSQLGE